MDEEKAHQLLEDALVIWRSIQTRARESVSIQKFADYLGVSKSLFIAWQNKERAMTYESRKIIAKPIADLVGNYAYDVLEVTTPNPFLHRIISRFENIPPEKQQQLAEEAEQYEVKNERSKKALTERKTTPR